MVRRVVLCLGAVLVGLMPAGAVRADTGQKCTVKGTMTIVSGRAEGFILIPGLVTFTAAGTCGSGGSVQPIQVTEEDGFSDIPCGGKASAIPRATRMWFNLRPTITIGSDSYDESWESPEIALMDAAGAVPAQQPAPRSTTPFPGASPFVVPNLGPGVTTQTLPQALTQSSAGLLRTPLDACKDFAWTENGFDFTFVTSFTAQFVFRG